MAAGLCVGQRVTPRVTTAVQKSGAGSHAGPHEPATHFTRAMHYRLASGSTMYIAPLIAFQVCEFSCLGLPSLTSTAYMFVRNTLCVCVRVAVCHCVM